MHLCAMQLSVSLPAGKIVFVSGLVCDMCLECVRYDSALVEQDEG